MNQENEKNIKIELNESTAQGTYSNLSIINHTDSEFILDFIYLQPNVPKGRVHSRIIITPQNAKRFLLAMQDNVKKYESKHGQITTQNAIPTEDLSVK